MISDPDDDGDSDADDDECKMSSGEVGNKNAA